MHRLTIKLVLSFSHRSLLGLSIWLFASAPARAAVSFNLDFEFGGNGAPATSFGGDSGQTGFRNTTGAGPGLNNMFDLTGAVDTGVDAFIQILNGGSGMMDPNAFYSDFIGGAPGPSAISWSFSLSNFPSGPHTLWVYASDQAATGAFTVDDGNGPMAIGSVLTGQSVAIPFNVTGAGVVSVQGPADGSGEVAGLQVVGVPEPGSAALAGLGMLVLLSRRRHRRRS